MPHLNLLRPWFSRNIEEMPTPDDTDTAIESTRGSMQLWAIVSVAVLVLVNLFVLVFLVPRFTAIFHDMIGNRPLPVFTAVVIHCRWMLSTFDGVCMLIAIFGVLQRLSPRYGYALLVFLFAQIPFTVFALFLPLNTTT